MADGYEGVQLGRTNVGYGAAVGNVVMPKVAHQRPATEMEQLSGNLADTARRLTGLADKLQARIDGFLLQGQTASAADPAPEPQPGSLSAIRFYHKRIDEQAERIDTQLMTLAGIL